MGGGVLPEEGLGGGGVRRGDGMEMTGASAGEWPEARCGVAVKTGTSPLSALGGVPLEAGRAGAELTTSDTGVLVTRRAEGGGGVAPVLVPPLEEGWAGVELAVSEVTLPATRRAEGGGGVAPVLAPPLEEGCDGEEPAAR